MQLGLAVRPVRPALRAQSLSSSSLVVLCNSSASSASSTSSSISGCSTIWSTQFCWFSRFCDRSKTGPFSNVHTVLRTVLRIVPEIVDSELSPFVALHFPVPPPSYDLHCTPSGGMAFSDPLERSMFPCLFWCMPR